METTKVDEQTRLREEGDRIEALLEEVSAMAGPQTWQRMEELLHRTVALYGAGLERVLSHVAESGAASEELKARLCEDELVSSLLLLHGLHPRSTEERVRQAVEELRAHLDGQGAEVELQAIDGDSVRLRLRTSSSCGSTAKKLEADVQRIIHEMAPEVARIDLEGASQELVQLDLRRPAGARR